MGRHMLLSHWPFFLFSAGGGMAWLLILDPHDGNPEKEPKIKWAIHNFSPQKISNGAWRKSVVLCKRGFHFSEFWPVFLPDGILISLFGESWGQSFDVSLVLVLSLLFFCKLLRKELEEGFSFYSPVTDVDSTEDTPRNFVSRGKHISIWFKWKVIRSEGKPRAFFCPMQK